MVLGIVHRDKGQGGKNELGLLTLLVGQWIRRVFQAKDACGSFAWISYALLCIVVQ